MKSGGVGETPASKKSFSKLKWIGIGLIGLFVVSEAFGFYRSTINRAVELESLISEQTKKEALYELSAIQTKPKTQGVISDKFSKLESDNVQRNMDSKRSVTMGVMSLLGSDLKNVSMPTNGMMELQHTNEFYKTLMANAGSEYNNLKTILVARSAKITEYEKFSKDPLYGFVLRMDDLKHVCTPDSEVCLCGVSVRRKKLLRDDWKKFSCYACTY